MIVSVIMTVKNGGAHLVDALNSVLYQTHRDFEVVAVDDGSSDDTLGLLNKFAKQDNRFRVIETGGVGRSKALNIAINEAKSDLIANLDADDVWHPDKLRLQVEYFKSGYTGLICTDVVFIRGAETAIFPHLNLSDADLLDVSERLLIANPVNHSSVMFNRRSIKGGAVYNEGLQRLVDYELWCRMKLERVAISKLNKALVGKRIHDRQSFENKKRLSYLYDDYRLRAQLIRKSKAGFRYNATNFVKLLYGLLPQGFRVAIKKNGLVKN